jgi:hypothetical protein
MRETLWTSEREIYERHCWTSECEICKRHCGHQSVKYFKIYQ